MISILKALASINCGLGLAKWNYPYYQQIPNWALFHLYHSHLVPNGSLGTGVWGQQKETIPITNKSLIQPFSICTAPIW